MKLFYFLPALAVCLLPASGCRSPFNSEQMERELRYQEDMIYQLQDYIHTYKSHLHACRTENESLRQQLKSGAEPAGDAPRLVPSEEQLPVPRDDNGGDFQPPRVDLPDLGLAPPLEDVEPADGFVDPAEEIYEFVEPADVAELADGTDVADGIVEPPAEFAEAAAEMVEPAAIEPPADHVEPPVNHVETTSTSVDPVTTIPVAVEREAAISRQAAFEPEDQTVAQLTLNTQQTGGFNADGMPGDEGLSVALEPLNADGQILRPAGKVSIAVLDPVDHTRFARWHLSAGEVARLARELPAGSGVALQLAWPDGPPERDELHIFVRLLTPDGGRFVADCLAHVDPTPPDVAQASAQLPTRPQAPAAQVQATSPVAPSAPNISTGQWTRNSQPAAAGSTTKVLSGTNSDSEFPAALTNKDKGAPAQVPRVAAATRPAAIDSEASQAAIPPPRSAQQAPLQSPPSRGQRKRPQWTPYR